LTSASSLAKAGQQRAKRTAVRVASVGVLMFGFAFALVPLYDMVCNAIGLNGKTNTDAYSYDSARTSVDKTRLIRVEFLTINNDYMPWKFYADKSSVRVHPGELKAATFHVHNPTDRVMVGQAVPNVAPSQTARYFHKTECFCFEQQRLAPGESLEMPLRFLVDTELPAGIRTISLSYTLFDASDYASPEASGLENQVGLGQTVPAQEVIGRGQ